MSEHWSEVTGAAQTGLYGSSIYGNLFYVSSDWTEESTTTVTWSDQSTDSTTWTE